MNTSIIDSIRMPAEVMPPHDAVFEVSATPFQATAVGMLYLDTAMKLNKAKHMADAGYDGNGKFTAEAVDEAADFLSLYGDASALSLGSDAIARLATPPSRLSMLELSLIACVCQIGVQLMPNTDDWAACVSSWLCGVRQQIIDDHAVRSEVSQ